MTDSPIHAPDLPGWGDRLVEAHNALRGFVAAARAELPPIPAPDPALSLTEQLRNHCQTICVYLHGHHTSETDVFFPHLAAVNPELGPALDRLRQEHVVVDRILNELDKLVGAENGERVRAELDRLAAELEDHFAYEEAQLVPTLNALTGPVPWETPD